MNICVEAFEEFLMSSDLVVKKPYNVKTFTNQNGSSVIDLIIVRQALSNDVQEIEINKPSMGPHSMVQFKIQTTKIGQSPPKINHIN